MQGVRDAMGQHGLHAGPLEQDLQRGHAARRGIALVGGGDVQPQLPGHAPHHAEAEHPDYRTRRDDRAPGAHPPRLAGLGPEHWQTWLAGRLQAAGAHVQYPDLPACDVPCPDRWGAALQGELRRLAAGPGERIVICHSLGCVLWLREAARIAPRHRVDRVVLVAPPCPGAAIPELAGFYPTGADRAAVDAAAGHTRLVCSDDDDYCPGPGAPEQWGRPLGLEVDLLPGAGHLNVDAGYGPWPAMRSWALGEVAVLAQAEGAKNGAEM
ncbi:RBBP9/YdeN family alpha/beta hydrolase [Baekduia soli]|uniref:RBBP9/YdeN family alpha/beta hydrolase n=1 Tax=Baekduia soli TaxID=496014 RepID=UPI001E55300D|nr:alpha/beta hydrolase [Baekduia soli]